MNFSMIGNMNSYLYSTKLQNTWNVKQETKNYTQKTNLRQDQIFEQMYSYHRDDENGNKRLSSIQQKLYAGGKLSSEEREYLRVKNPQLYNQLVQEEQEQKAYEKKLKQCKTKEDVERLRTSYVNGALSKLSAVENNPNIPKGAKLAAASEINRRVNAIAKITQKFTESGEYAQLPTDAEKALAEKKEAERKRQELEAVQEGAKELAENLSADAANTEQTDKIEQTTQTEAVGDGDKPKSTDHTEAKTAEPQETKPTPQTSDVLSDAERHVESNVERKVRRAKAKAAYAGNASPVQAQSAPAIDTKA